MYSPVFRNRWIALAFVLFMAMGAAQLVGDENDAGVISQAAEQLIDQRADFARQADELSVDTADVEAEFAEDDDLIAAEAPVTDEPDSFSGFDPVPDMAEPSRPDRGISPDEMAGSEIVIVDGEIQIVN